jgi:hypothetical protein
MLFWFYSLIACNILSLFSVLIVLTIICHGEILFWSCLFGVLEASCMNGHLFLKIWEIFYYYLLNIFCIPFAQTSSPLSMSMIHSVVKIKWKEIIFSSSWWQAVAMLTNI